MSNFMAAAAFAIVTASVVLFFLRLGYLHEIDMDPHSDSTALVFAIAPLISITAAVCVALLMWLAFRIARAYGRGRDFIRSKRNAFRITATVLPS
jgi:hypothetical protein